MKGWLITVQVMPILFTVFDTPNLTILGVAPRAVCAKTTVALPAVGGRTGTTGTPHSLLPSSHSCEQTQRNGEWWRSGESEGEVEEGPVLLAGHPEE